MTVRILIGDVRERLRDLPDESVHCVVTSPPYFGLRDYGTASWEGGDPACRHSVGGQVQDSKAPGAIVSGIRPGVDASRCRLCGAIRKDRQIGLEQTPAEFVAVMVDVFREVRRVLRADGTCWLNLGDSYASSQSNNGGYSEKSTLAGFSNPNTKGRQANDAARPRKIEHGAKHKDLLGIPWRVAFALQADGWWLRQDIIWAKPNPMPESVTDRCTKAHEYLFLLTKSARYHFDAAAIAEKNSNPSLAECIKPWSERANNGEWKSGTGGRMGSVRNGRNRRSVWTVATEPFKEAHFATFPPSLVEPCILAGCPKGGTVLDPFGGAGTTGLVADRLQRDAILIELNPAYAEIARRRLEGDAPMFAKVEAA